MFQSLKDKLIFKLSEAKTVGDYRKIQCVFDYYFVYIMKDFVTNSSSSSFVCDICGYTEIGDVDLEEVGMMKCVNGHTFCCEEALEKPNKKEMIKTILENEWNKSVWDPKCRERRDYNENELLVMDDDDLWNKVCTDSGCYGVPECVCPICQFIEYSEGDLSAYLLKEYKVLRDEVFEEVKKFNKLRKDLYDVEYITYVCKKFNLNPTEIVASWKERFGTYSNFEEWLRS